MSEIRNFEPVCGSSRPTPETLSNLKKEVRSFSTKLNSKVCKFCSGCHLVNICPKFLELPPETIFGGEEEQTLYQLSHGWS